MADDPNARPTHDLGKRFTYHPPHGTQQKRYELIREKAGTFASSLEGVCPPSRELSLALTKLEEAMFWANAAIARNEAKDD